MNSDKHPAHSEHVPAQRGNAMIYILIALALLGALTMVLASQNDNDSSDLSGDQAELLTTRTVAFVGTAKNAVDQMMMAGTPVASLDFTLPSSSYYGSGSNINKVFHPDGGGLSLDSADPKLFTATTGAPDPGWYMGRFNNVEWTVSTANDVILSAMGISQAVCANIDKKITGSATIPVISGDPARFFVDAIHGGASNSDFMKTDCAECEGYPSLCVSSGGGTYFTYYNIISGQ